MAFGNLTICGPDKRTGITYKGKEILVCKQRGHPLRGIRKKVGFYQDEKKVEAASLYAVLGKTKEVAELCKVPESAIRKWKTEEWFWDIIDEIREENNDKVDAKFTEIVEKSLDGLIDRIENGDHIMSPKGEVTRMPVKARDLASIISGQVEKRELLRGKPTSRSESVPQLGSQEQLKLLAEQFVALAGKSRAPVVIEAEVIEVQDASQDGTGTESGGKEEGAVG